MRSWTFPVGNAVGELGAVLGDGVATLLEVADRFLDLAAALAQFALDADAGFTDLALKPVAAVAPRRSKRRSWASALAEEE